MRTINILIVIFFCRQGFGQIKNFESLISISSKKMFIQVVLENGYFETDESGQGTLLFGNFDLGPMEAVYVESSGNWAFGFNNDVSDSFAIYNAIRDDIYSKCTFKQLVRNNGRFVACYTCPNTTYKGLIGCANESEKSYVMYFSQKFIDNLVE